MSHNKDESTWYKFQSPEDFKDKGYSDSAREASNKRRNTLEYLWIQAEGTRFDFEKYWNEKMKGQKKTTRSKPSPRQTTHSLQYFIDWWKLNSHYMEPNKTR